MHAVGTLVIFLASGVLASGVLAPGLLAQEPVAFEVASIQPSREGPGSPSGIAEGPDGIVARNVTLRRCVRGAYNLPETQISGGPKWADEDRFDIRAKAAGRASGTELMAMLRTLLADRFQLVVHREVRSVAGYRLVVAKSGLKATSTASEKSVGQSTRRSLGCTGCTMEHVALKLAELLRWPVADATGLKGGFDLRVDWQPEGGMESALMTALQEQAGLRLESGKVNAEVVVIDSAARPSGN